MNDPILAHISWDKWHSIQNRDTYIGSISASFSMNLLKLEIYLHWIKLYVKSIIRIPFHPHAGIPVI